MSQDSIFDQVNDQIKQKIQAKEIEVQTILREARERYIAEMQANVKHHQYLAEMLTERGDHTSALRHCVLVDIYSSIIQRA